MTRSRFARTNTLVAVVAIVAGATGAIGLGPAPRAAALDNAPWVLPFTPPKCTTAQAESGDVGSCLMSFFARPDTVGFGVPPAPGVGEGWVWAGYSYSGSPALASWEATQIGANAAQVAGFPAGTIETHVAARALFEGFLDEITALGYRVRDVSGYSFRCTSGSGGWQCGDGLIADLSLHAWGLAIDMNSGTNPIRTYSGVDGRTACQTPIQTDMPRWVIQTAEKWGLYWGGYGWTNGCQSLDTVRASVTRDPPHFEFRGTPRQAAAIAAFNLGRDPLRVCRAVVDEAGNTIEACNRGGRPEAGWRLPVDLEPPAGATAALINLTAADATAPGFLTLEHCAAHSGPRTTSALTYPAGLAVASMAVVPLDAAGRFCIYRSSPVHSIVDVAAYLGSSGQPLWFQPTTPTRLTDTRVSGACSPAECAPGPVPALTEHLVPTGSGAGRIVNLTAVESAGASFAQVGRCADVSPDGKFSTVNATGPDARANMAVVPPGDSGMCALSLKRAHLIVDELGLLDANSGLGWRLAQPRRAIDTRECSTAWCDGRPAARSIVRVPLGVAAPAAAVAITITQPAASGFVTIGTCDELAANAAAGTINTSNANYVAGANVTALAMTAVDQGEICVYTHAAAHVIVDVQAELTAEHALGVLPIAPTRVHDSRLG